MKILGGEWRLNRITCLHFTVKNIEYKMIKLYLIWTKVGKRRSRRRRINLVIQMDEAKAL
jgi:hypothetical protein